MIHWRCLLLVYSRIDVTIPKNHIFRNRFVHELSSKEINDAIKSFESFPGLVANLTEEEAGINWEIVHCERALTSLTKMGDGFWWPSPTNTAAELKQYLLDGTYHSVFVLWPQTNFQSNESIRSAGWGLGMGGSDLSMGATYATVANAPSWMWEIPLTGEIWLHEWLHGVCYHFSQLGYKMPDGDADGGERHGYTQSPECGWTDYYRDLMNGRVVDNGEPTGIPKSAWSIPLHKSNPRLKK